MTTDFEKLYTLNSIGIRERNFSVDAPFLLDPISLQKINYFKYPIEIVNFKSFSDLSEGIKNNICEQINQLFMLSDTAYTLYQTSYFIPMVLDEVNCINPLLYGQHGLFVSNDIPEYHVLGFYSGIYVTSFTQLEYLMHQFTDISIARYGNACHADGIPVICGHYNGNYMTLINDWRPYQWYEKDTLELEDIKSHRHNADSIILKSGDYFFVAYISKKNILKNTEIITDYGIGYWEREKTLLIL